MPQLKGRRKKKYAFHNAGSTKTRDILSFFALFFLGFVVYECIICYAAFNEMQATAAPQTASVAPAKQPTDIPIPLGTPLYQTMYIPTIAPTERPTFPPMGLSAVPQPTKTPTPIPPPPVQPTPVPTSPPQPTPVPTSLPQPTPVPTSTGTWTTVYPYSGNGIMKTHVISVPTDWRIAYTCAGMDTDGITSDGLLIVTVISSDNTPVDTAVNSICKAGTTTRGVTEEHQAGQIFLDINSTSDWTIQVQEMV